MNETKPFRASFSALIDHSGFSFEQSGDYRLMGGAGLMDKINGTDSAGCVIESRLEMVRTSPVPIIQNSIGIYFINHIPDDSLNFSQPLLPLPERIFRRLFTPGKYGYTYLPSVKGGVIVTWYDGDGRKWGTGADDPADTIPPAPPSYAHNEFEVVYSTPVQPGTFNYRQEVHMTFSCWIYNDAGDSIFMDHARFNTIFSY